MTDEYKRVRLELVSMERRSIARLRHREGTARAMLRLAEDMVDLRLDKCSVEKRLSPVEAVYERFKHLDALFASLCVDLPTDEQLDGSDVAETANMFRRTLADMWKAVKEAGK